MNAPLVQSLIFRAVHLPCDPPPIILTAIYGFLVIAAVFLPVVSVIAMFCIWLERKLAGHFQSRIGPNRVGPFGLLQSIADGIKLLLKEDLLPSEADRPLMRLAPYLTFAPVFMAFVALPFAPDLVFEPRLSVGLFLLLSILSVEVMGIILAGWASNNKWSVYGAMREACQMVSYEIPLGLSIIIGVMAAGTLNLVTLGFQQGGGLHTWIIFRNPFALLAFFTYFIASLASNKRAPFDLPESESELVAGYHTEYSGLRFSYFFFAEYAAMFVVGGIQAALFLGGWNDPFGIIGWAYAHYRPIYDGNPTFIHAIPLLACNLVGSSIFAGKALLIIIVQMWIRWTLPRPRIDQVLYACVKVLLPAACALLLGAAVWGLFVPNLTATPWTMINGIRFNPWSLASWHSQGAASTFIAQVVLTIIGVSGFGAIIAWIAYSIATGRGIKKRLTDPAPIDLKSAVGL
ncbi:MAG: NADH-quinone oxidoreductase subunit NuoH [Phycisphaerae bacterium]|nr:NADH-quinone oxidoreductase subunit NuoH [Phycisphaerae bacterium]